MMILLLLLHLQDDPVEAAMTKIRKALGETPNLNLARTMEMIKLIENEGTFLESQGKAKEQAAVYAQAAEALGAALEKQESRTGWSRKAIITLQKAAKRAEKKKDDAGRVTAYVYAFQRVGMAFQVECAELNALVQLSMQCFNAGAFDEAEEAIKEVEDRLPGVLGKDLQTTSQNIRLAPIISSQLALVGKRYSDGGSAVRRLIEIFPEAGDLELSIQKLHPNAEDYESAIRKLSEHVSKNPDDLDARVLLGFQYYFGGDSPKAKAVFASVLEKKQDDAAAKYFLDKLK